MGFVVLSAVEKFRRFRAIVLVSTSDEFDVDVGDCVERGREDETVGPAAADQRVGARAAVEDVVADRAQDRVRARVREGVHVIEAPVHHRLQRIDREADRKRSALRRVPFGERTVRERSRRQGSAGAGGHVA